MKDPKEFWQRNITDTLSIELVPSDRPCIVIKEAGKDLIRLELEEARTLIEGLNVAVGELFILKKDPATLARVRELLEKDITLSDNDQ